MSGKAIGQMLLDEPVLTSLPEGISTYIETKTQLSNDGYATTIEALVSSDLAFSYYDQHIWLSAKGQEVGNVDCADFIKDGMLSDVQLCDDFLVFSFNIDGQLQPLSVSLSSFADTISSSMSAYYTQSETSSAIEISDAFYSSKQYVDDNFLSLSGGCVSGDLSVNNSDFYMLSGNYVQTTTPDNVYVYSAGNSFIQAESTTKYGSASIGSRGFIVLGVVSAENKVTLSANGAAISDIIPTSCYTSAWSIALDHYLDAQFSEISTVGADYVIFKKPFNQVANTNGNAQSYFIELIKDDNALYCPTHPEIGNCVIPTFRSNHIEGGSTHATAQFAHAEGRSTFAEGRYSHAEGHGTLAAGTGAHAEGMGSKALENRGVHAEGWSTVSFGNYGSHSEGCETSALGTNGSHAEGYQTIALDVAAHAEGVATKATGSSSHAEGYKSEATNYGAHAEGGNYNGKIIGGKATGIASHAEGLQTTASAQTSHAEGAYTKASGNSSHAEGKWSYSIGTGAHAEGISCIANGNADGAHAEGFAVSAIGAGSHA